MPKIILYVSYFLTHLQHTNSSCVDLGQQLSMYATIYTFIHNNLKNIHNNMTVWHIVNFSDTLSATVNNMMNPISSHSKVKLLCKFEESKTRLKILVRSKNLVT